LAKVCDLLSASLVVNAKSLKICVKKYDVKVTDDSTITYMIHLEYLVAYV